MSSSIGVWSPERASKEGVTATSAAIKYLRQQLSKSPHGTAIHFGIKKSGCSGYSYILEVIESPQNFPHTFSIADDLILVIDEKSWNFVKGTEIDFFRDGLNGMIKYRNPNEASACGCGESFSVDK